MYLDFIRCMKMHTSAAESTGTGFMELGKSKRNLKGVTKGSLGGNLETGSYTLELHLLYHLV